MSAIPPGHYRTQIGEVRPIPRRGDNPMIAAARPRPAHALVARRQGYRHRKNWPACARYEAGEPERVFMPN